MSRILKIIIVIILILPGSRLLSQPAQDDDQIYEFVTVEDKPVIRNDAQPDYPQTAINAGIEGTVVVTVVIDKQGIVRFIHYGHSMRDIPSTDEILAALQGFLTV